jgi:hypothetical protein
VVWVLLAVALVGAIVTGLVFYGKQWIAVAPKPRALTPFPGKLVSDLPQVNSANPLFTNKF